MYLHKWIVDVAGLFTLRKGSMSETISDTSGHILTSEMTDAEGRLEVPEGC